MKKRPMSSLGGMLGGALARHGIDRQVLAANVVRKAENLLGELLKAENLTDLRPLSFKNSTLLLAGRHPAAVYDGQGIAAALAHKLEELFPDQTIRVEVQFRPDAFLNDMM